MQIFNDLPQPAVCLDTKITIIKANRRAAVLFGWRGGPPQSSAFTQFLLPEKLEPFLDFFENIRRGNSAIHNTTLRLSPRKTAQVTINASLTDSGNRIFLFNLQDVRKPGCGQSCNYAALLEAQYQHNPGGILLVDKEMNMLSYNREFVKIWEIPAEIQESRDEEAGLQSLLDKLVDPQGFLERVKYLYENIHECGTDELELKDGRTLYRHTYPLYSNGTYLARVWYFLDVTLLTRARQKLEKQQIFQNAILEHVQDAIIACDENGKINLMNKASRRLYGVHENESIPETLADIDHYHGDGVTPVPPSEEPLRKAIAEKFYRNNEMVFVDRAEKRRILRVNGQTMSDAEGGNIGAVISLHDITDLREAEEKQRFFAYHDQLTGLPNRRLYHDLLLQILRQSQRNEEMVGVLFLDLDNFKAVNDQYGHYEGDKLLQEVSNTLKECLRDSDILCRWGGDEFVISLPACQDEEGVVMVAEKLGTAVQQCILRQDNDFQVSVSIGIAVAPTHGMDPDRLIRNADIAMYRAKHFGKNRCELFSPKL